MTRTARTLRAACMLVAFTIGVLLVVSGSIDAGLFQHR